VFLQWFTEGEVKSAGARSKLYGEYISSKTAAIWA